MVNLRLNMSMVNVGMKADAENLNFRLLLSGLTGVRKLNFIQREGEAEKELAEIAENTRIALEKTMTRGTRATRKAIDPEPSVVDPDLRRATKKLFLPAQPKNLPGDPKAHPVAPKTFT